MNVIFFGSSSFSVPALKSIPHLLSCVVTKRARPKGRGYLLEDNDVRKAAAELNLPVIEIDSFKDEAARQIEAFKPELFVVASFGLIVPRWALDLPSIGPINVHPSLLPKYRGPSPIQWALWKGEGKTGITLIRMNEKMDAGDILYQETAAIAGHDNMITLSERLAIRVAEILPHFVDDVEVNGLRAGIPQRHEEATYTPIITKEMGKIDWGTGARQIVSQIKALAVWPRAYALLDGSVLQVFDADVLPLKSGHETGEPGKIKGLRREGFVVSTVSGDLIIKEVQLQNKKRLAAWEFTQGHRGLIGKTLQ